MKYFTCKGHKNLHKFYTVKKSLSFFIYMVGWIVIWNVTPLGQVGLWKVHIITMNHLLILTLVGTIIYAYKKHLIQKISFKFNYTNYMQRIQECLFADRMINDLIEQGSRLWDLNKGTHNHGDDTDGVCLFEDLLPNNDGYDDIQGKWESDSMYSQASPMISTSTLASLQAGDNVDGSAIVPTLKLDDFTKKEKEQISQLSSSENSFGNISTDKFGQDPFALNHSLILFRKLERRLHSKFDGLDQNSDSISQRHVNSFANTLSYYIMRWLATKDSIFINNPSESESKMNITIPKSNRAGKNKDSTIKSTVKTASTPRIALPKQKPSCNQMVIKLNRHHFEQIISDPKDLDRLWSMITIKKRKTQSTMPESTTMNAKRHSKNEQLTSSSGVSPTTIRERHMSDFIQRYIAETMLTAKSLKSMDSVIHKLDIMFNMFAMLIFGFFAMQLIDGGSAIVSTIVTSIAALSFMFSSSAKNIFESAIYIFAMHPYDIGDRVYISLIPGAGPTGSIVLPAGGTLLTGAPGSGTLDNLLVLQVELLSTTFERWDGAKVIVPNYILATKPLINVRRSGAIYETHRLQVGFMTDLEVLQQFKNSIQDYILSESKDYVPTYLLFTFDCIDNMDRLLLTITLKHCTNWQDWEAQISRRSNFVLFMKETLTRLNVTYDQLTQKVEFITVPPMSK